jgi:4-hydroxythreonine-4-phosphate dehydrogenase
MNNPLPLVVALGDPSGVGPEIAAKAWEARQSSQLPPFFVIGDQRSIEAVWAGPMRRINTPAEALGCFADALPVLHLDDGGAITPGVPNVEGARCSIDSLEMAVGITRSGAARALVTCPVAKAQLYAIGFTHPGQTEFIAERCGVASANAVMMLAGPSLRVVPITTHIPLREVPEALTVDLIIAKTRATLRGLMRNFGIAEPRLVMAGLNPHAGEDGALGREEIEIIIPALEQLRAEGIEVVGPVPADALFHARARAGYDAALCMYHDQALIPLKALHFDEGVNITLGLPIIRTSPDHGTAFDIAGKNRANPGAMIAAIQMAGAATRCRANHAATA